MEKVPSSIQSTLFLIFCHFFYTSLHLVLKTMNTYPGGNNILKGNLISFNFMYTMCMFSLKHLT